MTIKEERIFLTGATGNVGSAIVRELIQSGAKTTVYVRSPKKVPQADNVAVVQGDYDDWTALEKALPGHTRLFLLVGDVSNLPQVKLEIAKRAYAAGIKQIVDMSAIRLPWRDATVVYHHSLAEDLISAIPNRGVYVTLRPTMFMSNQVYLSDTIREHDTMVDTAEPHEPQEYISPRDIALAAVRIMGDPIDKHADAAYELVGDVRTPSERAAYLSKALGRTITYKQISVQEAYGKFLGIGWPHAAAFFLATYQVVHPVSRGLPLLLGRSPESFEEWAMNNKASFE